MKSIRPFRASCRTLLDALNIESSIGYDCERQKLRWALSGIATKFCFVKVGVGTTYTQTLHFPFVLWDRTISINLNIPPLLCAVLHTFCLYLFNYSESLLQLLRFVAILSASRRSCRVDWRRVICNVSTKQYKQCHRAISSSVMIFWI